MVQQQLTLNCDLGEGLDAIDAQIMPHINQANIACGGHAGNIDSMVRTIALANQHNVAIGAHPSYPDRANFGRKSLRISHAELYESLMEQIIDLVNAAAQNSASVQYIKPHGALYNDCVKPDILESLIWVAQQTQLPIMLLAGNKEIQQTCQQKNIPLIREAFVDRRYSDEGLLLPRAQANALLNHRESLQQAQQLKCGRLITQSGKPLHLECDSLCIHSDTAGAVETAKHIKAALKRTPA